LQRGERGEKKRKGLLVFSTLQEKNLGIEGRGSFLLLGKGEIDFPPSLNEKKGGVRLLDKRGGASGRFLTGTGGEGEEKEKVLLYFCVEEERTGKR